MKKPNKSDKGITLRKDGRYSARFVDRSGKRQEKYFKTLPEARNWLDDARNKDKQGKIFIDSDMTVDEWFDAWISSIETVLERNTIRNYTDRYTKNIQPIIGTMKLSKVKPLHCQSILNHMRGDGYAATTIDQTYSTLGTMLKAAVANSLIEKHPLDGVTHRKSEKSKDDVVFLTIEEQEAFLNVAKNHHNYEQYLFLLETGLRIGELMGLTWNNIDFEKRTITLEKSLEYRYQVGEWVAGPLKSTESYRTLPLTNTAFSILAELYSKRNTRKEAKELNQILTYKDKRNLEIKSFCMKDLVFINWRTGMPTKTSSYDTYLIKLTSLANVKHISSHSLRHTYATRAIERGVNPSVLQKLLGHKSITTTMGTYVHITDDSLKNAVSVFEDVDGVKMVSSATT